MDYYPTAHVHALTREFPVISLTLGQRLATSSGVQEAIPLARHAEVLEGAAMRLSQQSALSLHAVPTIEQVVEAYHGQARLRVEKGHPPAVLEMEDSVLIAAAAGRRELVEKSLRDAGRLVDTWPESRLPLNWPGRDVWLESLADRAEDEAGLSALVDAQIAFQACRDPRCLGIARLTKLRCSINKAYQSHRNVGNWC